MPDNEVNANAAEQTEEATTENEAAEEATEESDGGPAGDTE